MADLNIAGINYYSERLHSQFFFVLGLFCLIFHGQGERREATCK